MKPRNKMQMEDIAFFFLLFVCVYLCAFCLYVEAESSL